MVFPFIKTKKNKLAARRGIEPRLTAPKTDVLPLDERALNVMLAQ